MIILQFLTAFLIGLAIGYLSGFTRGFHLGQLDERERSIVRNRLDRK